MFDITKILGGFHDISTNGVGIPEVTHDATLSGKGTVAAPLTVVGGGGGGAVPIFACVLDSPGQGYTYYSGLGATTFNNNDADIVNNVMPKAGTLSSFYVNVSSATLPGTSVIGSVSKNGVPTLLSITIPAGSSGVFSDTTHTVSVIVGDLVSIIWVVTGPSLGASIFSTGGALVPSLIFE